MTDYLKEAREFFAGDIYALDTTGITIDEAAPSYAVCSLSVSDKHKNAAGVVMGGAIFTLADLTFAVAANVGQPTTVTYTSNIIFLAPAAGTKLTARAICEKSGRHMCAFRIEVTDDSNSTVAVVNATGCRIK